MEKVKLGQLTNIKTGRLDVNAENPNGKYPFFTCSKNHTYIDEYAFDGESVLVAGNGDLNVKYYNGKFNAYQRTYVIQANENLNGKFLYYFLDSYVEKLREQSIGGVIKYIKLGNLTDAEIPLPNLATQQRIAAILDQADAIIQNNRAIVQKYDALTQSLFLDMFGDPVKNEKGWNLTKFSNVLTKIESGWSPVCENYSRGNEKEWAVLKLGAVSYGIYNPKENKKCGFEIPNSKIDCEVKQGNLLFTRKNTYHMVGKTAFVHETEPRLLLPDTIFRLVYNSEKANPIFLYYLLNHNKFILQIQSLASGTSGSMPNISKAKLLEKDLIFPSVELQNQFAERVAVIEAQKQQAQLELAKSEELFNSLLQRAFKGELS